MKAQSLIILISLISPELSKQDLRSSSLVERGKPLMQICGSLIYQILWDQMAGINQCIFYSSAQNQKYHSPMHKIVMLSPLPFSASSYSFYAIYDRSLKLVASCPGGLFSSSSENSLAIWSLVSPSQSPSLASTSTSPLLLQREQTSGSLEITPGSPPYFLTLASTSPIVLDTFKFPGMILCSRNILNRPQELQFLTVQASLLSFPPFFRILSFYAGSVGLWSFVNCSTAMPDFEGLSSTALLSPTLARNTLEELTKLTTPHDPLVNTFLLFSQSCIHLYSSFTRLSFSAQEGSDYTAFDLRRVFPKFYFRYQEHSKPPCPSKTPQISKESALMGSF